MPWSEEHKAQTRARIIKNAAAAFRRYGVNGVSVKDIMSDAGLTHGGFYAHFSSKDQLLSEALAYADAQATSMLNDHERTDRDRFQSLASAVATYLGMPHCLHPEQGCPIAALGPEIARESASVRKSFATRVRERIAHIAGLLPRRLTRIQRQRRAMALLSCMVGAVILARILDDQGEDVLKASKDFIDACGLAP
jgi:TetR/AcrR family transcriptional repressor of nem operon